MTNEAPSLADTLMSEHMGLGMTIRLVEDGSPVGFNVQLDSFGVPEEEQGPGAFAHLLAIAVLALRSQYPDLEFAGLDFTDDMVDAFDQASQ